MASDARAARDMALAAVRAAVTKTTTLLGADAINERALKQALVRLRRERDSLEAKQATHLARSGRAPDDPEEAAILTYLQSEVVDQIDSIALQLEDAASDQLEVAARQALERRTAGVMETLRDLRERVAADLPPEVVDVLVNEQGKAEETFKGVSEAFLADVENLRVDARGAMLAILDQRTQEVARSVRDNLMALAPLRSRPRAASVSGVSNSLPQENSSIWPAGARMKPFEFPKFDGDARRYPTFRQDFRDAAREAGITSQWELSLRLRNQCLVGDAKEECVNEREYEKIWEILDELYSDPHAVVDDVNERLVGQRQIGSRDYGAVLDLIRLLDRAAKDLEAAGQASALSNPQTCRLIQSKLPEWIQTQLIAHLRANGIGPGNFPAMLRFLTGMRGDVRQMASLAAAERRSASFSGETSQRRERRRGTVAALVGAGRVTDDEEEAIPVGGGGQVSPPGRRQAAVAAAVADRAAVPPPCVVPGCTETDNHFMSRCGAWVAAAAEQRWRWVNDLRLCRLCFSDGHVASNCPRKSRWKPCGVAGCKEWHHRSLHAAAGRGAVLAVGGGGETALLAQSVLADVGGEVRCGVMWDTGAEVSVIREDFARARGLRGSPCTFALTAIDGSTTINASQLYQIALIDATGRRHCVGVYGVPRMISRLTSAELPDRRADPAAHSKPADIQIVMGMHCAALHPEQFTQRGGYVVYRSRFGTGWLAGGGGMGTRTGGAVSAAVCATRISHVRTPDFISAEALGVDRPKLCRNCVDCRECKYKSTHMSWEESRELAAIEAGLTLDVRRRKWQAAYPFRVDPAVISDNRAQAMTMLRNFEKRLARQGRVEEFDALFQEAVGRGVFVPIPPDSLYTGPVHYISLVEAYKTGPALTTPIRLCLNSSLRFRGLSLNDLLCKGPPALNDLFGVLLAFRGHRIGLVKDVRKFYQSVEVGEREFHLRRVLWRGGREDAEPTTYGTATVNFGDKPAGCIAMVALRETAKMQAPSYPLAADMLINATYVDDVVGGAPSVDEARQLSADIDEVGASGGFFFNPHKISGADGAGELSKVLGMLWDALTDTLSVDTKLNITEKLRGVRTGADIQSVEQLHGAHLSRRIVWRVALGQYDPLGLLCPYLLRLKLQMRQLSATQPIDWEQEIPSHTRDEFLTLVAALPAAGTIRFPRSAVPAEPARPWLLIFVDGAQAACCTLVYVRWMPEDGGQGICFLLAGKTRVAPLKKLTIPRMELQAAILGVRLAARVQQHLHLNWAGRRFFTDSTAVLGMIRNEASNFPEFVANRVAEIRSKADGYEWRWVPTAENLADIGTRGAAEPADLEQGTPYQCGHSWMEQEESSWPSRQDVGEVPAEEQLRPAVVCAAPAHPAGLLDGVAARGSLGRLLRVAACVLLAVDVWRRRTAPVRAGDPPGPAVMGAAVTAWSEAAWDWCVGEAQMGLEIDRRRRSHLCVTERPSAFRGAAGPVLMACGRSGESDRIGFDPDGVVVLGRGSRLAELVIREAHCVQHAGVERTVLRARRQAWVLGAAALAKNIIRRCYACRLMRREPVAQRMYPLPDCRVGPAPPFHQVAVDLFGPIAIRDAVRRRVVGDTLGLVIVCLASTAVHLEILEDGSAASLILALRRFIALRGTPAVIRSDPGRQMLAAGREVALWRTHAVKEFAVGQRIRWDIVPSASQHKNGLAERMVGLLKRALAQLMQGSTLTKGELDAVAAMAADVVNSRPLQVRLADTDCINPLTPNHLLLGRATAAAPQPTDPSEPWAERRLAFMKTLVSSFWSKWTSHVLPMLLVSTKWYRPERSLKTGDVVLIKYESKVGQEHKLGRVKSVRTGLDGLVRTVSLDYVIRQPGGQMAKGQTSRSVHNVVLVVPIEEQSPEQQVG